MATMLNGLLACKLKMAPMIIQKKLRKQFMPTLGKTSKIPMKNPLHIILAITPKQNPWTTRASNGL